LLAGIIRDVNFSKRFATLLAVGLLVLALGSCRNSEPAEIGKTAPDFTVSDGQKTVTLSQLRGKPVLLNFWLTKSARCQEDLKVFSRVHARWAAQGLGLLTVNMDDPADGESFAALARERRLSFSILRGSDDVAGIYNILYRYLFDRHRDLGLPTSFLIDSRGDVVKIYQGPVNSEHVEHDYRHIPQSDAERLARALPFPGMTDTFEFGRNYLSSGSVFFQRGYYDQAAASFQLALRDDPSSAEAFYGLGSAYLNLQKTAEARKSFERAVKLPASYPDTLANAWNNLGLLATRENRTDQAVRCFEEAVRLLAVGDVPASQLVTRVVPLKDVASAFELLEGGKAMKIMIDCGGGKLNP